MKASALIGAAACGMIYYAIFDSTSTEQQYINMTIALGLVGAYDGASNTAVETIFADR